MRQIRLLPVVVLAVSALLVLKTMGLVTNGGYVLTGVGTARAAGGGGGHGGGAGTVEGDGTATPAAAPTLEDTSPTITDAAPTLGELPAAAGGHGAPAAADHGAAAPEDHAETAAPAAPVEGTTAPVAVDAQASSTGAYFPCAAITARQFLPVLVGL